MKTLKVILIGAGNRGRAYTDHMVDDKFQVVAVCEPSESLRNYIKELHNVPEEMCFESWEKVLEMPKFADVVIIATTDALHYAPTMKAIERGYDLLLEKPISPDYKECVSIANYAKKMGTKILVCHVLRYSPFFMKLKEMINEKKIGRVMSIHHIECVGNVHQSHSFVRGNWGNSERSSCMLLQKSCHDIDIMQWLVGKKCKRVHSFGSLTYFTKENAPVGAPERCIDGCPYGEDCYYNSVKYYLEDEENLWGREICTKKKKPSNDDVAEALRTTQYGKCVYKCDNDVVDHQVVNLEYEDGTVASFNMCAFNDEGRFIKVMGTDGELCGNMESNEIDYYSFKTLKHEIIKTSEVHIGATIINGHGGGDKGIVNALYDYITGACTDDDLSEIGISTENHLTVFAAEKSRLEHCVVDVDEFNKEAGLEW